MQPSAQVYEASLPPDEANSQRLTIAGQTGKRRARCNERYRWQRSKTRHAPIILLDIMFHTNQVIATRKLLIVDDNPGIRTIIRKLCDGIADTIIEASNGKEAIEFYAQHRPDWTIIDIEMPVMDGLTATRSICQEYPDAQIVVTTHDDEPEWRQEAIAAGAKEFVPKDTLGSLEKIIGPSL